MSLTTDIAADFLTVDGLEAVTLTARAGGTAAITHALQRAVSTREAAASGGRYTMSDVAWHFPATEATPQIGDTITDGLGNVWRIIDKALQTFKTRWRCMCRVLAIEGLTQCSVVVQRRANVKASDGTSAPTWATVTTKAGWVSEQNSAREVDHGRRSAKITARLYFVDGTAYDQSYRFTCGGYTYYFVSDDGRDSITDLYSLTVERNT